MATTPVGKGNIKVVFIGDSGVGKSSIAMRIANQGCFHKNSTESTIGAAFFKVRMDRHTFELWDTAGAERFQSILPMYVRGAHVIIAVYDVSSVDSLQRVVEERKRLTREIPSTETALWILVGNKVDLPYARHLVSGSAAASEMRENDWNVSWRLDNPVHLRVSASSGENVNQILPLIADVLSKSPLVMKIGAEALVVLPNEDNKSSPIFKLTDKPSQGESVSRGKCCV